MITINFVPEAKRRSRGPQMGPFLFIVSVVLTLGVCAFLYISLASSVQELSDSKQDLEAQIVKLKEATKDVQKLENLKTELRKKLVVVASLKKKKKGPVHILDDVNTALPDRAWVTQIGEKAGALTISGVALDNQTISEFMERLSKSEYLAAVDLVESKQETKDQVKVQGFVLQSKALYGGKNLPEGEVKPVAAPAPPPPKPAAKKNSGKDDE